MVDRARVVAPVLVGRERELELLAAAVSSPPAVVTIEGEAGIGKTRLVSELASLPALADRHWLWGGCRRIQEPFPLGPVIEAVRGAADALRGLRLSPIVGALRPLLPELEERLPAQLAPLGDRSAERHRVFRALAEVLAGLGPVGLVLEDMHWADDQTLEFVGYLAADPPEGLALVLTFRSEEVAPAVRGSIAKLPRTVGRAELRLAPLDAVQTAALGAAILGTGRISEEFAAHLCARASGVPFAIEELLALLQARGTLVHGAAGWARRALTELDVPSGIRDMVLERASRLSQPARAVVEAAAVLEVPAPAAGLVDVSGLEQGWALGAVDEAVSSGLLAERGHMVAFRHVLAAQAVYESIPGRRRGGLHGRAAAMIEAQRPVALGQLAHHLRRADRAAEWTAAAEAAADAAIALGHDMEAVRLLEEPLRETPLATEQRWRLALKLGRAVSESGSSRGELVELLAGVLEREEGSRLARGELRFWLAMAVQNTGSDTQRMRRLLIEAVADLAERADLQAWAMVTLGIPVQPDVAVTEHKRWLERALGAVRAIGEQDLELFLVAVIAMGLAYVGDRRWRDLADEIVARTGGAPRSHRETKAYLRIVWGACYLGAHERAESLLAALVEPQATHEHPRIALELAARVALLDFFRGNWEDLRERVLEALDEVTAAQLDAPVRVDLEVIAGCLALAAGDTNDARRQLVLAAEQLEGTGNRSLLAVVVAATARQALATGELADAIRTGEGFIADLGANELWAPLARPLPALTQMLIASGQESQARHLVDRFAEELRVLDAPLGPAALAHARGLLDSAQGQATQAVRELLAAAEEYARLSCPYEAAQAREHAARALFEADPAGAERGLRAALEIYRRLGATWDHTRAVRLGREHGVRLPATHRSGRKGYGAALSPREQQVARLAAAGLSNKAIAAELYLSPNTVDKHLGRAMRKLGVHSRAAVAPRLAEPAADEPPDDG